MLLKVGDYVRIIKIQIDEYKKYIDCIGSVYRVPDSYYLNNVAVKMQDGVILYINQDNIELIPETVRKETTYESIEDYTKRILKESGWL